MLRAQEEGKNGAHRLAQSGARQPLPWLHPDPGTCDRGGKASFGVFTEDPEAQKGALG